MASHPTVRTLTPSACTANIRQERTGLSSTSTVQAPQTPCSQPRCVPVRPQSSRNASAKLRRGTTRIMRSTPFTVNVTSCLSLIALRTPPRIVQYPLRRNRHFEDTDTKRCQRIGNRVEDRRRRADRAALADTLGTSDARPGQGLQMMDFEFRDFRHRWHEIVGKRAGQDVAVVVINDLSVERVGDALRDAAVDLPLDDHWVDQAAGVLDDDEPLDLDVASRDVDRDDRNMAG